MSSLSPHGPTLTLTLISLTVGDALTLTRTGQLLGHGDTVISLAVLRNGRLSSGSRDRTIRIWDLTSLSCLQTLSGHTEGVNCIIEWTDGLILSG